jgi:hypothetical protein
VTTPAGNDPYLFLAFGCLASPALWDRLSRFTPTALGLAALTAILLLTASVGVVVSEIAAFRREPGVGPHHTSGPSMPLAVLWMAALFLLVFSAKLLLMREYALTVPFWDSWDGEARGLYLPFNECRLSWGQRFSLHNEHRVFFTRLLSLGVLIVNGQWDPRLQQVVNAAMHALTAILMVALLWMGNERRHLDLLVFVCAVAFALPFSWENTLIAFQSAFYFQLLFSLLALWLTTSYHAGTGPWCLGGFCAVCGLFTAAGGVLTPLAIAGAITLKLANDRREWREPLITLGAAAVVFAFGMAMASPPLPHHAALKARTAAEFAGALGRNLAWPWVKQPKLSIVMWLPLGALLVTLLRRAKTTALERLTVSLGVWVALQAGAIAYGRGAGAPSPAPRYQDFLSLGFVANTMAMVVGLDRTRRGTMARRLVMGALGSWLLISLIGVDRLVKGTLADLSVWRQVWSAHAANVRRFIVTGDLTEFTSKQPLNELPYPDAQSLASVLQDPYIRRVLPATVRAPVHVEPRVVTNDAFVSEGSDPVTPRDPLARAWGSFSGQRHRAQGRFESQPIASCQRGTHLRFPVAGYLGLPHQYLAVKELRSGRELEVRPGRLARESWISALVPCPDAPYAVIAVDESPDDWFAFREPVEVGGGSPVVESLIARSSELLLVALVMAVLGVVPRWT